MSPLGTGQLKEVRLQSDNQGATGAGTCWVATLADKTVDDAVENDAVEIMIQGKEHKTVHCFWCLDGVECNDHGAH